jgi:hypothetical protein
MVINSPNMDRMGSSASARATPLLLPLPLQTTCHSPDNITE